MSAIEARFSGPLGPFDLDVSFSAPGRGVTALFGPSGCGKTSVLRCIAGLNRIKAGTLSVNDEIWQDEKHFLPVHQRPIGYVFQEASLFPHLSVRDNLLFGAKRSKGKSQLGFDELVDLLGLSALVDRAPGHLSGGERQRVAIGRALLSAPQILLMDEPLAALDRFAKRDILPYLERLHSELAIPVLYVSHDLSEVERLADHMIFMEDGRVKATGSISTMLARLDLPFHNDEQAGVTLDVTIREKDINWNLARAAFPGGSLWVKDFGVRLGHPIRLRILASDIAVSLSPPNDSSVLNVLPARIDAIAEADHPSHKLIRLMVGETALLARLTSRSVHRLNLATGMDVYMQIKSVAVVK